MGSEANRTEAFPRYACEVSPAARRALRLPSLTALCALLLIFFFAVSALPGIFRGGFSPDEELTHLAATGVSATGLPLMPSGTLYGRGLPYSYACAIAGRLFGPDLPVYRTLSFLFVCLGVGVLYLLARAAAGPAAALVTVALMTMSPWTTMAAQWARFYGMGLFLALAAALFYTRNRDRRQVLLRFFPPLLGLATLCLEAAAALLVLPLFDYLAERTPEGRRRRRSLLLLSFAALSASQVLALFGIVATLRAPSSGTLAAWHVAGAKIVMPRFFVGSLLASFAALASAAALALLLYAVLRRLGATQAWSLLLAVSASLLQPALIALLTIFALLVDPPSWRLRIATAVLAISAASFSWTAIAACRTAAPFSPSLGWALFRQGLTYPTAALVQLVATWPLLCLAAFLGAFFAGQPTVTVRALVTFVLGGAVLLDHANAGPQPRYFLPFLPFLALLAARGFGEAFDRQRSLLRRTMIAATAAGLIVTAALEQSASTRHTSLFKTDEGLLTPVALRWSDAPLLAWRSLASRIEKDSIVVCNDAPACAMVGLQPTFWYLENPADVTRFSVPSAGGNRDIYTGARIITGRIALDEALTPVAGRNVWAVSLETGKYSSAGSAPWERMEREDGRVAARRITSRGIRVTEFVARSTGKET